MASWSGLLRRPPDDVRAVKLNPGERVLAWASIAADGAADAIRVLATDRCLRVLTDPPQTLTSLFWHDIVHAVWEADASTLIVEASGADGRVSTERFSLDPAGAVPEVVRERVSASIIMVRHVPLDGPRGARLVARRVHGTSDIVWQVHPDAGIQLQHSDYRQTVQRQLAELRRSLG